MTEGRTEAAFLQPEHADALRALLAPHDYTESSLRERFGFSIPRAFDPLSREIESYKMNTFAGIDLLARLFLLGDAIQREDLAALTPSDVDACIANGWLAETPDGLRARGLVGALGNLIIASDRYENLHGDEGVEHVLTVNPVARNLVQFMVRTPCGRVLDLCGGGGIQGLVAAAHAEEVVSTDLNPRATAFAAFNARLNQIDNLEARSGAGLEPVAGERFDQIVCNPPFVMTPSSRHVCTDNPKDLDEFSRDMIREAARHLNPGGLLQIITEWVELSGEPWSERLIDWVADCGCDAFLLRCNTERPETYVRSRLQEESQLENEAAFGFTEWLEYFSSRGVRAIHGGLLFLKRMGSEETRKPHIYIDEIESNPKGLVGEAVRQTFEHMAHLKSPPEAFAALRLAVPGSVRLAQQAVPTPEGWHADRGILIQHEGLERRHEVDGGLAELTRHFDGSSSVAEIVERFEQYGATPEQLLPVIRNLFGRGFLSLYDG